MIKVTCAEKIYEVPTNFNELTWSKYVGVLERFNKNLMQRISWVTSIPEKELYNLTVMDFTKLCEIVSFIDVCGVAQAWSYEEPLEINIGAESYGKLEASRQKISQAKNYMIVGGDVFNIYMGEDISELPLPQAMAKVNFIYARINGFLDRFKELYEGEPEAEEVLAGVQAFQRFGCFPTLDRLVKEYGGALIAMLPEEERGKPHSPHDLALLLPAEVVMNKLLFDFQKGEYEQELFKIRSHKKE